MVYLDSINEMYRYLTMKETKLPRVFWMMMLVMVLTDIELVLLGCWRPDHKGLLGRHRLELQEAAVSPL